MCCKEKFSHGCWINVLVKTLLIVGGLNWGLVGIAMFMQTNLNVVNLLLGKWSAVEAIVYLLVGIAAVMKLFGCCCKKCKEACAACAKTETPAQPMQ